MSHFLAHAKRAQSLGEEKTRHFQVLNILPLPSLICYEVGFNVLKFIIFSTASVCVHIYICVCV